MNKVFKICLFAAGRGRKRKRKKEFEDRIAAHNQKSYITDPVFQISEVQTQTREEIYQTREVIYQTGDVVYQTGDVVYQTGDVVYQTGDVVSIPAVEGGGDVLSEAVGVLNEGSSVGPVEGEDEDSDEEEQELGFDEVLHDGLVYFDSCYKTAQAVTYNKKDESGILMVRSTTQLLHAFIGIYYGFQGAWSGGSMPGSFYNLSLLQQISISPNHGLIIQRRQEIS